MSTTDAPLLLFELPAADTADTVEAPKGPVQCSECPRMLYSEKSIAAGVGPGCAAKMGRVVIIAQRRANRRRQRRQRRGSAAA